MTPILRMRAILLTLFLAALSQFAAGQCEVLVWSDEFNGTGSPNSAFWNYDLGQSGWGNNEVQNYTSNLANVRQENGNLIIEALKSGNSWTSARLKTQGKKSFRYGKIVFRAKLPTGSGTWPALWMLGDNITSVGWPACGEIDVMEHVGKNQNVVQAAMHTPSSFGNTTNKNSTTVSTASTEFHEYAVSWNAERMVFLVDNVPFYTYNPSPKNSSTWPFDLNQFLIMNIAMGGNLGSDPAYETGGLKNGIDPALVSAKMEIDYVRVYEERTEPLIQGPQYLFQNQQGVAYTCQDYGAGVSYTWTVPAGANLVSGQGTRNITVDWGVDDGILQLALSGITGCTNNNTSLAVSTLVDPAGPTYVLEPFTNPSLPGWSKNDNGITYSAAGGLLTVSYNVSGLKYLHFAMPKAIHLSDYGILKIPIRVPSTSSLPGLVVTFIDGSGNETLATNFELPITKKDGNFYTYAYNFDGLWGLNNPAVNDLQIKSLRLYMLPGSASFQAGPISVNHSKSAPAAPPGLSASITTEGDIALNWTDVSNAVTFNLYRAESAGGTFTKIKSGIKTSEVPYVIKPTASMNYYKVSAVNGAGESPLTDELEVIATVTGLDSKVHLPISVYPNPCNGRFFVHAAGAPVQRLQIFDSGGKEQPAYIVFHEQVVIVDLKTITPGIYFMVMLQGGKTVVAKVVVN
jgi:beta-glucanase (GH16 family)